MRIVDLFAGAGGSSIGAVAAGARVVWAANHWPVAVEVHRRNHPTTDHACQDLHQVDWRTVPQADLVWASPACQGHSRAASLGGDGRRGTAPHHDALRSTAWAVVSCLECHKTPFAIVENVVEFRQWVLYPAWCAALEALGYSVSEHVVDAVDFGVPQSRKRLFLVLSRSRNPLRLQLAKRDAVPFATCIDGSAAGWTPVITRGRGVRERVARARRNHPRGLVLSHYVTDHPGRSIDRPIGTVTTKVQWALVRESRDGDEIRFLNALELRRAMGFPDDYELDGRLSTDTRLLGNAVCPPVAAALVRALKEAA